MTIPSLINKGSILLNQLRLDSINDGPEEVSVRILSSVDLFHRQVSHDILAQH